ncbi:FMN-binding negative transcriptional regulator [Pseudonocardia sp. DSM 110487]|uniref:FMN-binding negative transcriptional regulator n=1 Tax=Pseudonocardia sp. DSM 110487 TaxID=2865833 RepID=UPI00210308C7|nr:FMN-binding negative transcriptional regulator [Pseudonocardia sp. DSM 110487]
MGRDPLRRALMFEFPRFATDDPRHAVELVRAHPFALVVSSVDGVPVGTNVPVIEQGRVDATFVGTTLLGHMAKANPHWRGFEGSPPVLVVFGGPHGYVSPTAYATDPAVPTWNYAAVHLTGTVELITDPGATLAVVEATVRAMESTRTPAWCPSARSRERFAQILPGVVAFRIHVTAERSLFKLSQDIDAERRGRVQDELRSTGNVPLADLMEEVNSA